MSQVQSQAVEHAPSALGVLEQFIREEGRERRRILWAFGLALLFHLVVFVLHLEGLFPDRPLPETEPPEQLIAVQLELPELEIAGGGGNRELSKPPEPTPQRLPLKSEPVPVALPVPFKAPPPPQQTQLPSLDTRTQITAPFSYGPVEAPPGTGGTGGGNGAGEGRGIGDYSGPSVGEGIAGRGGFGHPIITFKPRPEWTEEARRNRIQGTVELSATFGADGVVRNIRVLKGLGYGLDEKAIEAAKMIKFIPARGPDGRPASVRATIKVEFNLL
ncbi:MAG TPA: energy transducer TonB [Blastocatellia bacterium]|nr:energy transducer TonB [Blastocatellia bacterium]